MMRLSPRLFRDRVAVFRNIKAIVAGVEGQAVRTLLQAALKVHFSTLPPVRVQSPTGWTERAQGKACWYPVQGLCVKPGDIFCLDGADHIVHSAALDRDGGYWWAVLEQVLL